MLAKRTNSGDASEEETGVAASEEQESAKRGKSGLWVLPRLLRGLYFSCSLLDTRQSRTASLTGLFASCRRRVESRLCLRELQRVQHLVRKAVPATVEASRAKLAEHGYRTSEVQGSAGSVSSLCYSFSRECEPAESVWVRRATREQSASVPQSRQLLSKEQARRARSGLDCLQARL